MPSSDMPSVRGIGVAVSVSTSTSARSAFSASFWRTPKRCSSSMMTRPRRLNFTSLDRILWVPMTMSTRPSLMPSMAVATSLAERKRDSSTTRTGQSAKRSAKVWACCSASSVVGHSRATCLPLATARKAARSALGLAEAHVATDQPVHGPARGHVGDHRLDGCGLVGGFLEAEALGEGFVVVQRQLEGIAFARGALRVQGQQLGGGVAHLRPCGGPCPTGRNPAGAAARPRDRRRCSGRSRAVATRARTACCRWRIRDAGTPSRLRPCPC